MNKLPRLAALSADDSGWGFFLCTYKEFRTGRSGGEFLFLSLQDSTGQIVGKLMTDVDRYKNEFDAGEFVRVEGRGSLYNGQVQLVLSTIRRINPDQDRQQGFREEDAILSAPRPIDQMWEELQGQLRQVRNDHIRVLLNRIVADNEAQLRSASALTDRRASRSCGSVLSCISIFFSRSESVIRSGSREASVDSVPRVHPTI